MASCERCWEDAQRVGPEGDTVAEYERLIAVRQCTPEQQAGRDGYICPTCKRMAMHQHVHRCMACGYEE